MKFKLSFLIFRMVYINININNNNNNNMILLLIIRIMEYLFIFIFFKYFLPILFISIFNNNILINFLIFFYIINFVKPNPFIFIFLI